MGDCLKTMMFTRNQFHGHLEEGIQISHAGDVKVMMMNPCEVNLTNFEFEEGIKNDIGQFKILVEKIEVVTPVDGPRPSFVILFHLLCDIALGLSGKALRDVAYFIYANAAFYDDEEKIKLIFKLWDFFEPNIILYETLLTFTEAPVDMRNWQLKLYEARYEALRMGYRNNKKAYVKKDFGIFKYHKNTLEHFSEEVVDGTRQRLRLLPTMRLLSEAFPEFIPKLFYLVATKIREREADFGEQDALTGNIVDNDLVLFLRNGRDALP